MRKTRLIFYCSILLMFCQYVFGIMPVWAASQGQEDAIYDHCETIRESLKTVQKTDSRTRVYLGSYYEKILTKFIMQLNFRLVENSVADAGLTGSQTAVSTAREKFNEDYVEYQKGLENLIAVDCKAEPGRFYEELVAVRAKRATVRDDATAVRKAILEHVSLVREMLTKMKEGA